MRRIQLMDLSTSLLGLSGIGSYINFRLKKLELNTVEDLIFNFPFRYDDFSNLTNVLEAKEGEVVTLTGEVWSIKNVYTRSRKIITQAIFNDGSSPIELTWFNQSWLIKQINTGDKLQVSGKISKYKNKLSIIAPRWEKLHNAELIIQNSLHTGRLVPIYSETIGLTSKWLRQKVADILPRIKDQIEDPLPDNIRKEMLPLKEAIQKIHFPENYQEVIQAKDRLGFDELFFVHLATGKARLEWKSKPAIDNIKIDNQKLDQFIGKLPFTLTQAQLRVIKEITRDLEGVHPMNRLVQGEVGSGKTVVAAIIAYLIYLAGYKTYYMAPTEILAFQHYTTLTKLLSPYGINLGIYTGSKKFTKQVSSSKYHVLSDKKQKSLNTKYIIPNTEPDIIVGTHALLSPKIDIPDIGLVIVDEQQRFGVEQRSLLRSKAQVPHFLTMTATPIPRTVALTVYGDLDISVIDELPKGRREIKTHFVPNKKRKDAYEFIRKQVKEGDQVYLITPLIDESETQVSAKAATVEFEKLKTKIFPDLRLGLLHGRLKPKEKEEVLNKFKDHEVDILVSTSVVEVGVDVPNATIMVIESAERFGLAQLHQLRGRVGRGEKQSYCFLFAEAELAENVNRLKNLERIDNGLKLAELDLKIRGSGEIFGVRQSGRLEFKIASFSDLTLIEKTKSAAQKVLEEDPSLDKYPQLRRKLAGINRGAMPD